MVILIKLDYVTKLDNIQRIQKTAYEIQFKSIVRKKLKKKFKKN
jgi:hypothetical protein